MLAKMEDEWEDESIVFVELSGVPNGQLNPRGGDTSNQPVDILGLATDRPLMHVNGQVYVGEYEDSTGTLLFLDKTVTDSKKSGGKDIAMEYYCQTDKKLVMKPAYLLEKSADPVVADAQTPITATESCVRQGETTSEDPAPVRQEETTGEKPAPAQQGETTGEEPAPAPVVRQGETTGEDPAPVL